MKLMKVIKTRIAFRAQPLIVALIIWATLSQAASFTSSSGVVAATPAHKFYTSLTDAEYNRETKSLEISMRVFADDLELALTRRAGKAVYLDSTANVSDLILAYLRDSFQVKTAKGDGAKLDWVGMETRVDVAWLFFEMKLPEGLAGAQLRNRLLFEMYEEQINIVNIKSDDKKFDFVFKRGDEFQMLATP